MLRLRHVFTTTGATLIGGGLSVLLTLLVARLLTPTQNGHYAQFYLVFNLYYILVNFGIGPASTYMIASGQVGEKRVTLFNIGMVSAIGVISLLGAVLLEIWGFWHWVEGRFNIPRDMMILGLMAGFVTLVFNQCIAILMGKKRFDTVNCFNVLKAALPLAAIGGAILVLFDERGFAVATMLALAALSIGSTWYALRTTLASSPKPRADRDGLTISILRYGGLVYASNVLHYLAMRGLLLILSYYFAPEYVGFFSIALVLLETVLIVPGVVGTLLFPQSSSPQFSYRLTDAIMRLNSYVGLLAIGAVLVLAAPIVEVILGSDYQLVAVALAHLTPSILLLAVPRILSQVLSGQGHPEYPLCAAVLSFFLGGALAFWSIPAFGVTGAAWVTNFVSGITAIVTIYGYTRLRGVSVAEVFRPRQSDLELVGRIIRRASGNG